MGQGERKNTIADAIKIIAVIDIVGWLIIGVALGRDTYGDFSFISMLIYWVVGLISCFILLGFAELIYLLQGIYNKASQIDDYCSLSLKESKTQTEKTQADIHEHLKTDKDTAERVEDKGAQAKERINAAIQANAFDPAAFVSEISELENTKSMYDIVLETSKQIPDLFDSEVLNRLHDCVTMERMYGKATGKNSFIKKTKEYFSLQ